MQKALAMFDTEENIGHQTHDLNIQCSIDSHTMLKLPKIFPNVELVSVYNQRSLLDEQPSEEYVPEEIFQELKKWKHLETICDTSSYLPFTTSLLESGTFHKLTKIFISFVHRDELYPYSYKFEKVRPFVKALIHNLKNAPALKQFDLVHVPIDLDDMEKIHDNAPKLQTLNLMNAQPLAALSSRNGEDSATTAIETLCFEIFDSSNSYEETQSQDVLIKWLAYMGSKYRNIKDLESVFDDAFRRIPLISRFEEPIRKMISTMPYLKSYEVQFLQ